jgi:hypothetical protein
VALAATPRGPAVDNSPVCDECGWHPWGMVLLSIRGLDRGRRGRTLQGKLVTIREVKTQIWVPERKCQVRGDELHWPLSVEQLGNLEIQVKYTSQARLPMCLTKMNVVFAVMKTVCG